MSDNSPHPMKGYAVDYGWPKHPDHLHVGSYSESVDAAIERSLHERYLFKVASELHHRMSCAGGFTWKSNSETPTAGYVVSDGRR